MHKYDEFARWHMETYGTTREQLASAAVFMSQQAARNPSAICKSAVDVAAVLNSRSVSSVTSAMECARRADGAGAIIMVSKRFARMRGLVNERAVSVQGFGEASSTVFPENVAQHVFPLRHAAKQG